MPTCSSSCFELSFRAIVNQLELIFTVSISTSLSISISISIVIYIYIYTYISISISVYLSLDPYVRLYLQPRPTSSEPLREPQELPNGLQSKARVGLQAPAESSPGPWRVPPKSAGRFPKPSTRPGSAWISALYIQYNNIHIHIYIYICMCVYLYPHIYIHTCSSDRHIYMYTHTHFYTHAYIWLCTFSYVYIYICIYVYVYGYVYV